jgi:hypothetical protein
MTGNHFQSFEAGRGIQEWTIEVTGSIDPAARCGRKIGLKSLNVKPIFEIAVANVREAIGSRRTLNCCRTFINTSLYRQSRFS